MASDVMRVRLHLREIRVLAVALDTPSELRVEVESTVRRPRCPACGFRCVRVHDTRRRKVRDLRSASVTVPAPQPRLGQRHRRLRHTRRTGRPNAGRSTSTTARSPSDHNGPPQPSHGGLAARQRTCTRNGPPPSSPTLSTSTSPSPTNSSHMRVGSYSTGILQSFGGLLNADSGGSLAFNRGPSRSSLRPQTRRAGLASRSSNLGVSRLVHAAVRRSGGAALAQRHGHGACGE